MSEIAFLRRVGVVGDVHVEEETLQVVLTFLQKVEPPLDALICTGDIIDGSGLDGDVNHCCTLLREAGVLTVRGNHDRWLFERANVRDAAEFGDDLIDGASREFLAHLPVTREFATPRGRLLLCHGLGDDDMAGVYPEDGDIALERNHRLHALVGEASYRWIINGHTHVPMVRTFEERITIINAGTLQWAYGPCFWIVDFGAGCATRFDLNWKSHTIMGEEEIPLPV